MDFREFVNEIKSEVECKLSKEYQVDLNHVLKNNGIELVGLVIHRDGDSIAPNIYLNDFYDAYMEFESIETIVEDILKTYNDAIQTEFLNDFRFDYCFESIKDKIYYRVVNYSRNKNLLEDVPYKKFLDLVIVYYCLVDNNKDHVASIRITNEHIKKWGISQQNILEIATENTPRIFPGVIRNMKDVIKELILKNPIADLFGEDDIVCEDSNVYHFKGKPLDEDVVEQMLSKLTCNQNFDMYVLTNTSGVNGASAMLYNGLIESFANKIKSNVVILPSSIHEVIMIPFSTEYSIDELKSLVKEINCSKVPEGEVLSDSVYIYQRKECALVM